MLLAATSAWGAGWKFQREYRRPIRGGRAGTVVFSFCDGGHLGSAGNLLVADSAGTPIPSKILFAKRGGHTWVAYQGDKAKGQAFVYYGGRGSRSAPSGAWRPRLSLMLMTMSVPAGAFESYTPIANKVRRKELYGMGFVGNVSLGHNPYGPDDGFASAFVGYLKVKRKGHYHIFTASDDASYVLLDGKELCKWPGRHTVGGGRRGRHGRTVPLEPGRLYRIEYYHAEDKDTQCMALGWVRPGMKKGQVEIVPKSAFDHTPVARVGPPERNAGAPLAACAWRQVDQMLHGRHQYTRIRFTSQCRRVPGGAEARWAYGDESTHKGGDADHIYVGDGPFGCTVSISRPDEKGKTRVLDRYRTIVRIETPPKNLTILNERELREYIDTIVSSDCTRLKADTMRALWELVETCEDAKRIRPFCAAYYNSRYGLEGVGWAITDRLALAVSLTEPERSVKLYAKLAQGAPNKLAETRARMEAIEIVLHELNDSDRALKMATELRRKGGVTARLGVVKTADVHRARAVAAKAAEDKALAKKDAEQARKMAELATKEFGLAEKAYRAAAKVAYQKMDRRLVAMRQGGFLETVDTYVRNGDLRAARDLLVQWEIYYPDGKLGGDLILMTAKYFEKLGQPRRALGELEALTRMNPLTPFLPEVELRMARAYARLGKRKKADQLYDKVMEEYPKSRAAEQARRERRY